MPINSSTTAHLANVTTRGNLRAKIAKILDNMHGAGFDAQVYSSLRSLATQRANIAKGVSWTLKSNHLPGPDGLARAVDIADARAHDATSGKPSPWSASKAFWVHLARLALMQGMGSGILFGLSLHQKIKLVRFLLAPSPFRAENWFGPIGKDPAHVEERPSWLVKIIARSVKP